VLSDELSRPASGVLTFLFTDIEGSTRRWEADPKAMRAALSAHDALLQRVVDAHGGHLFNHTGDGVCAAFVLPKSAVDAAVVAQRELGLPVRMGIATGEAESTGTDYFGAVLNRAARVMAAGHGGQILLDGATAALLSGVDLMPLGPRRLRDITKPVDVFQVQASGVRADFPALKTVDATPGNLKPQTTSFIGRQAELDHLQTALKAHRLVTLTGVGGVGKTRLALEVAARSANDFPDGAWVIELAAVGDPAAVPDAAASVLEIAQQAAMSVADSVAAALEGRSRLLVFDNCEHVLDAAASLIGSILAASATVTIIATSREGLQLPDEQLWPVPSLDVRTGTDSAAALLFVERAEAVAPNMALTGEDESAAVVEICRRLDGIPLGIELAASRMVSMTATEVRDRLDDRFRLLVGSRRGLERHQTLRHAMQWSYDLLDADEQRLLHSCSVFSGGFDLAGVTAIAGAGDEYAVLDLLDALVRKSLVVADPASGRTRYSMLETIRQFAEEQLVQTGEADRARTAHAHFFAAREADVLSLWDSPRQREAYRWFTLELANLRTAFRWAADHDDIDSAATIATYAALLGTLVEQYEPVGWAEELIEPARALQHRCLAALHATATQVYLIGRIDDAIRHSEHTVECLTGTGHFDDIPFGFGAYHGSPYIAVGRPERWADACRLQLQRSNDSHAYARGSLAMALSLQGSEKEAISVQRSVVAAAEATLNPHSLSQALLAEGLVHRYTDPATALAALRRSLQLAQESGNRFNESHIAVVLSQLEVRHDASQLAFDHLALAIRNHQDSGNIATARSPLAILAALLYRLHHYEPAATLAAFAVNQLTHMAFPEITETIARLREVLGDEAYESFARRGESMTNAAMATYALDQIDLARADLLQVGDSP
jgi:predicted ATPase/class 3 adenylate cyclase